MKTQNYKLKKISEKIHVLIDHTFRKNILRFGPDFVHIVLTYIDLKKKLLATLGLMVLGRLPEIYTVRHGVTLKNKLFRLLIFVKIFFTAFFYSTS